MTVRIESNNQALAWDPRWQYMQINGKNCQVAINQGAKGSFKFTGTGLTGLFDVIGYAAKPELEVRIDGGAWSSRIVVDAASKVLASGLSAGEHTCEVLLAGLTMNYPVWSEFVGARIEAFQLDDGATVSAWKPAKRSRMLVIGNSLSVGSALFADNEAAPANNSARLSFFNLLAEMLGYEVHFFGFASAKMTGQSGFGGVPALPDAYLLKMAGYAYNDPTYDLVINEGGNNDLADNATLEAANNTLIDRIRATSPNAKIFCLGKLFPTSGDFTYIKRSAQSRGQIYVSTAGWSYGQWPSGHPTQAGHATLADLLYKALAPWLGNDEFDVSTQQDLKTGGDGAKSFGLNVLNSANVGGIDANITSAGKLRIAANATYTVWASGTENGPLVYRNITGDFDVETKISDNAAAQVESCGLIVRDPNASAGADHVLLRYGYNNGRSYTCLNTINSVGTNGGVIYLDMPYQKISRRGAVISVYCKATAEHRWQLVGQYTRSDFAATVQVGVFQQTVNTNGTYVSQFEYLRMNGFVPPTGRQLGGRTEVFRG